MGDVTQLEGDVGHCAVLHNDAGVAAFTNTVPSAQDLKEYFARPRVIAQGAIPTVVGPFVTQSVTESTLSTSFPFFLNRLSGVYGLRFTLRYTVQVAATPFQQGLLAASFQYGLPSGTDLDVLNRSITASMVTKLPHVRLDLAEATMAQLDIPFVHKQDFFNLIGEANNALGLFSLSMIMPYRTLTTAAAPTYRVYISLHDLDLIGAIPFTPSSVVLQSGLRVTRAVNKMSPISEEVEHPKVSSGVATIAKGIKTLGDAVPLISSFTGSTAWFLRAVSTSLSAFGYSKPAEEKPSQLVYRTANVGELHVDTPYPGLKIAPFQSNSLVVDSVMGNNDTDEMALNYVLQQYSQIFRGTLSTSDTAGTQIYGAVMSPSAWWFRANSLRPGGNVGLTGGLTVTTSNCFDPSNVMYIASMFKQWRGPVTFRITFSKTKFHAGRLALGFVPSYTAGTSNAIVSSTISSLEVSGSITQASSFVKVLDLKDNSVFEIDVPFVCPDLWCSLNGSTGALAMVVMDPLVNTGETATTIDFLVELKAKDGFELANYSGSGLVPITSSTGTLIQLQSGLSAVGPVVDTVTQYTAGEKFNSLKQILMIPHWDAVFPVVGANAYWLPPWWYTPRVTNVNPFPASFALKYASSPQSLIRSMYAYFNGATAIELYSVENVTMSVYSIGIDNNNTPLFSDFRYRDLGSRVRHVTPEQHAHVVLPTFSRLARLEPSAAQSTWVPRNAVVGNTPTGTSTDIDTVYQVRVDQRVVSTPATPFYIGRSGADDARCACFLGAPLCAVFGTGLLQQPGGGFF